MSIQKESNSLLSLLHLRIVSEAELDEATAVLKKEIFKNQLSLSNKALYSDTEFHRAECNIARYAQLERLYCLLMLGQKCIGWHYGFQDGPFSYYMCNSAIIPEYQRQGCYSWLAQQVMNEVQSRGFHKIKSRHHPTATAVLIAKLKLGFIVSGMQLSANFGTLVELEWNGNPHVERLMKFRCGSALPESTALEALGLYPTSPEPE